jgi:hypothetical protein
MNNAELVAETSEGSNSVIYPELIPVAQRLLDLRGNAISLREIGGNSDAYRQVMSEYATTLTLAQAWIEE